MTMVAVCLDSPGPSADAAFSTCTSVAWVDSSTVVQGMFDGISMGDAGILAAAVISIWGVAFGIRLMADHLAAS